ncbi:peptidase S41, partial [Komagataeibacter sp. FXV3]|nr:peptidase S41 [Komagataeibacter sp. FXV3]
MKRCRFPVIILRPQSRGPESMGTWRRRIFTLGHIPRDTIVLLLVIVRLTTAACADDMPTTPRTPTCLL